MPGKKQAIVNGVTDVGQKGRCGKRAAGIFVFFPFQFALEKEVHELDLTGRHFFLPFHTVARIQREDIFGLPGLPGQIQMNRLQIGLH